MTTKVVLQPVEADLGDRFAEHWRAVWLNGPCVNSLQGKNRKGVEAAVRIKLGEVEFYEFGSPEWYAEFCPPPPTSRTIEKD